MATLSKQERIKKNVFDQLNEMKFCSVKMTGGKTLKLTFTDTSITHCSALIFGSTGDTNQTINQVVYGASTGKEEAVINVTFDVVCNDFLTILSAYNFTAEEVK